jgi:hypothetical protein
MNALNLTGLLALVGTLVAFAVWLCFRYARKAGASQARADGMEGVIENVDKAKRAVHRLDADPDYRHRMRERHSRD